MPRRFLEHLGMRELLIQLQRELEPRRSATGPAFRRRGRRYSIEGRVDLDRVEVLGIERQLVELATASGRAPRRVEDAVPCSLSRRVTPARCPDTDFTHLDPSPPRPR